MPAAGQPKYRVIADVLRERILDGRHAAGTRLPSQGELAREFNVTVMTLRQALSALEAEGLVRAEAGRGTFVADRPVEVGLGHLSSFAGQLARDGVEVTTELVEVADVAGDDAPPGAAALGADALRVVVRRRIVDGAPIAVQRSYLGAEVARRVLVRPDAVGALYEAIAAETGATIAEATERLTAVTLDADEAALVEVAPGHPAIRSERTSIDQFGRAFLFDEALLVGGRSVISARRTSDRLDLQFGIS